jgi:hypothetical protein
LEVDVGKPLLDVLRDVVLDPAEQAEFTADPGRYLAQYGYDDVPAEHLNEAFGLVADTLPPDVAQAVAEANPPVDPVGPDGVGADTDGFDAATTDTFDAFSPIREAVAVDTVDHELDDQRLDGLDDPGLDDHDPGDDLSVGFGAGSVEDDVSLGGPDTAPEDDPGFDDAPAWEVPEDDGGAFAPDAGADALSAMDAPDLVPDHDDGHFDADDGPDDGVPDHAIGDDPGDFLDDIGSF